MRGGKGLDIDAVVAINANRRVIGTYFGADGYERAFLSDGTQSVDLGDPGDGDTYFVWPVNLNDSGVVAGACYDESSQSNPPPTVACQWQSSGTGPMRDTRMRRRATSDKPTTARTTILSSLGTSK